MSTPTYTAVTYNEGGSGEFYALQLNSEGIARPYTREIADDLARKLNAFQELIAAVSEIVQPLSAENEQLSAENERLKQENAQLLKLQSDIADSVQNAARENKKLRDALWTALKTDELAGTPPRAWHTEAREILKQAQPWSADQAARADDANAPR